MTPTDVARCLESLRQAAIRLKEMGYDDQSSAVNRAVAEITQALRIQEIEEWKQRHEN